MKELGELGLNLHFSEGPLGRDWIVCVCDGVGDLCVCCTNVDASGANRKCFPAMRCQESVVVSLHDRSGFRLLDPLADMDPCAAIATWTPLLIWTPSDMDSLLTWTCQTE